jgi:hypothetical protein
MHPICHQVLRLPLAGPALSWLELEFVLSTHTCTTLRRITCVIVLAAVARLVTVPFRLLRWNGAPVLFKDIIFALVRASGKHTTIAQYRYQSKDTTETYHVLCNKIQQKPNSIVLDNVAAHWIGSDQADIVLLYLHGMYAMLLSCRAQAKQLAGQHRGRLCDTLLNFSYAICPSPRGRHEQSTDQRIFRHCSPSCLHSGS